MHFISRKSYLIILFIEVRDYVGILRNLPLCRLANCKTFNIVDVGRGKYLSSTENSIVAKQIYMMSEQCRR